MTAGCCHVPSIIAPACELTHVQNAGFVSKLKSIARSLFNRAYWGHKALMATVSMACTRSFETWITVRPAGVFRRTAVQAAVLRTVDALCKRDSCGRTTTTSGDADACTGTGADVAVAGIGFSGGIGRAGGGSGDSANGLRARKRR